MRKKIGTVDNCADRKAGVQPDEVSYATTINALTKARSLLRQIKGKHLRTAFQISKHLVGFCLGDFPHESLVLSVGRNLGRPIWWMKPLICWCEWRRDLWSEGD